MRPANIDALRLYGLTAIDPVEQETLDLLTFPSGSMIPPAHTRLSVCWRELIVGDAIGRAPAGFFQTLRQNGNLSCFLHRNPGYIGPARISRIRKGETMKRVFLAATALTFATVAGIATAVQAADGPPPWAYGFAT